MLQASARDDYQPGFTETLSHDEGDHITENIALRPILKFIIRVYISSMNFHLGMCFFMTVESVHGAAVLLHIAPIWLGLTVR